METFLKVCYNTYKVWLMSCVNYRAVASAKLQSPFLFAFESVLLTIAAKWRIIGVVNALLTYVCRR